MMLYLHVLWTAKNLRFGCEIKTSMGFEDWLKQPFDIIFGLSLKVKVAKGHLLFFHEVTAPYSSLCRGI